ncbi:MAG: hypothetical protein AAFQ43_05175 [Bacteroidota bacterium]
MTDFDDRFADRVRDVFDAYEEPVDNAALARLQAALGVTAGPPPLAPDRPPLAPRRERRRWRAVGLAVFGALVLALGATLWSLGAPAAPEAASGAVAESTGRHQASGDPGAASGETAATPEETATTSPLASPEARAPEERTPEARPSLPWAPRTVPPRRAPVPARLHATPGLAPEAPIAGADSSAEAPGDGPSETDAPVVDIASVDPSDEAPQPVPAVDTAVEPDVAVADASPIVIPDAAPRTPVSPALPAPEASGEPLRLTVASAAGVANGRVASGAGLIAGVSREFAVGRGLSVSAGGALAYNRFTFGPGAVSLSEAFADVEPGATVDVTDRSEVETVAIEVPLDLRVGVSRLGRGRVAVGVGVTSAVYVAQSFRDEGQRLMGEVVIDPSTSEEMSIVRGVGFSENESVDPLGRIDLARQLNLSLGYDGRPLAVDAFARVPLRGVTSRDLPLTTLGVRLRVALQ